MKNDRLQHALQAATETEDFIQGEGCRTEAPDIFRKYFSGKTAVVVADENTFAAAGKEVHDALQRAQIPVLEPHVFPGAPILHAEYAHVETLREFLQKHAQTIPVAVGSGTINDLVKRAVFELNRRYMVVATAASVDGYSSFGAPISQNGFKKTMECPAPLVILADSQILRDAPAEMTAAGYADLASKITAGADWILADAVGAAPIQPPIWAMIQPNLRAWLHEPQKLRQGDPHTFEALFEGLTMTGLAMQAMRDSRPASGADHLMSHIWDMQHHRDSSGESVSHGFQVALGTLASTALLETVFAKERQQIDISAACRHWKSWEARAAEITQAFAGMPIIERVLEESRAKYLTPEQLRERLTHIQTNWESLRDSVQTQLIPYPELRQMFHEAGCPVTPEQINLTAERIRATYTLAQTIRARYTILDFAYELGWLDTCVDEVLASGVYLQ